MSENNKETRHQYATSLFQMKKKMKALEAECKKTEKKLVSMFKHRNLKKEVYEDGTSASLVQSDYPCVNKEKLAKELGVTVERLEEATESAKEMKPRKEYMLVR